MKGNCFDPLVDIRTRDLCPRMFRFQVGFKGNQCDRHKLCCTYNCPRDVHQLVPRCSSCLLLAPRGLTQAPSSPPKQEERPSIISEMLEMATLALCFNVEAPEVLVLASLQLTGGKPSGALNFLVHQAWRKVQRNPRTG